MNNNIRKKNRRKTNWKINIVKCLINSQTLSGHFTQVIWKNSTYLGVGAVVWEKGLFVVCNYEPPGNIIGAFVVNVPPPL